MAGTQGWVTYYIADWLDFNFRWDNPYNDDDVTYSETYPSGYAVVRDGSNENNATVKWAISESTRNLRKLTLTSSR